MARIYRLQPIQYDRRTGVIDPIGRSHSRPDDVAALTEEDYIVIDSPMIGWGQYTHLIATPDAYSDGWGAPYFLARFVEGEGPGGDV